MSSFTIVTVIIRVQLMLTTHVLEWDHPLGHGKAISSHILKDKWLASLSSHQFPVITQPGVWILWLPWSYEAFVKATTGAASLCVHHTCYIQKKACHRSPLCHAGHPLFLTFLPWYSLSLELNICSRGVIPFLVLQSWSKDCEWGGHRLKKETYLCCAKWSCSQTAF